MSRLVTQIKYLSMLLIKSCRCRAEAQSLQPLTDKVTTPYQRNILERNIKLRKNKPRFAQEVHLPRATLVVPDEVFVRQEIQTRQCAQRVKVNGFPSFTHSHSFSTRRSAPPSQTPSVWLSVFKNIKGGHLISTTHTRLLSL